MTYAPNIRQFLDLSTAHLKPETRSKLDSGYAPSTIYPHPDGYGWMLYVPDDPEHWANTERAEDTPADLRACIEVARELKCDYILFDCDAPTLDGLPMYDDDGNEEVAP